MNQNYTRKNWAAFCAYLKLRLGIKMIPGKWAAFCAYLKLRL